MSLLKRVPSSRVILSAGGARSGPRRSSSVFRRWNHQSAFASHDDYHRWAVEPEEDAWTMNITSPRQIATHLDDYVIGQAQAKKILSVAVFNHYKRAKHNIGLVKAQKEEEERKLMMQEFLRNHIHEDDENVDFSGENEIQDGHKASGSKLYPPPPYLKAKPTSASSGIKSANESPISKTLQAARKDGTHFSKSNVLMIGPTGSGKTLLARTLARVLDVPFAMADATAMTTAGYVGEDVESAISRLLQAANYDIARASVGIVVIDEVDKIARRGTGGIGGEGSGQRDVGGEGVQQSLLRLLEGSTVQITAKSAPITDDYSQSSDMASGLRSGSGLSSSRRSSESSIFQQPSGGKPDVYQVDTTNILFILTGAFVGLEGLVRKRMSKTSIGFGASTPSDAHEKPPPFFFTPTNGKNPELLDLVEPKDLTDFGFIPEFVGRLPVVASLRQLTEEDLYRILVTPKNALVKQFITLMALSGVELRFTSKALRCVAKMAIEKGTGARGLKRIMEHLLLDTMYECPESSVKKVLFTESVVLGKEPALYFSRGQARHFEAAWNAEENGDSVAGSGCGVSWREGHGGGIP